MIWHELIHYICTYPECKLLMELDCAFVILGCVVGFGTDVDAADMMFVEFIGCVFASLHCISQLNPSNTSNILLSFSFLY